MCRRHPAGGGCGGAARPGTTCLLHVAKRGQGGEGAWRHGVLPSPRLRSQLLLVRRGGGLGGGRGLCAGRCSGEGPARGALLTAREGGAGVCDQALASGQGEGGSHAGLQWGLAECGEQGPVRRESGSGLISSARQLNSRQGRLPGPARTAPKTWAA